VTVVPAANEKKGVEITRIKAIAATVAKIDIFFNYFYTSRVVTRKRLGI